MRRLMVCWEVEPITLRLLSPAPFASHYHSTQSRRGYPQRTSAKMEQERVKLNADKMGQMEGEFDGMGTCIQFTGRMKLWCIQLLFSLNLTDHSCIISK